MTLNWRDIVVENPDTGDDELVRTVVLIDPATGEPYATNSTSVAAAFTTGQNALSTTAEVVIAANTARRFAEVKNVDATISVYLGKDATLTTANGHLLKAEQAFGFEGYTGAIWCIAASGTPTVSFIQW